MEMEFLTIETMATMAGLVTTTNLLVQYTKNPIKAYFGDSAVRIYTLIIGILLTVIFNTPTLSLQAITLAVLNGVMVATFSMGTYEIIVDPNAEKDFK